MIRYNPQNQLKIEEFKTDFEMKLQKDNRWVVLANKLPWDALCGIYHRSLNPLKGAPSKDARLVVGAMIVKHMLALDDRETLDTIRENMYIQYFLGLSEYTYKDVFDRSLFTILRHRLGDKAFDARTRELIQVVDAGKGKQKTKKDNREDPGDKPEEGSNDTTGSEKNNGKLLLDATVADQMIAYPTDLGLIAKSREESERIIDVICENAGITGKPRTYRRIAPKHYLGLAKKKRKGKKEIRKGVFN